MKRTQVKEEDDVYTFIRKKTESCGTEGFFSTYVQKRRRRRRGGRREAEKRNNTTTNDIVVACSSRTTVMPTMTRHKKTEFTALLALIHTFIHLDLSAWGETSKQATVGKKHHGKGLKGIYAGISYNTFLPLPPALIAHKAFHPSLPECTLSPHRWT